MANDTNGPKIEKTDMNNRKNLTLNSHNNGGFTLLELSMVIIISGLLLGPLVSLYTLYLKNERSEKTKTNIQKVTTALAVFSPIRFPCPSDRSLTPNSANYGVDVCTISGFSLASVPVCNTSGSEQGICKAPGARDTEDDTDTTVGNNNEFVLIGGVPFRSGTSLIPGITAASTLDGWGNQMSYAVSYTSSRPNRTKGFDRYKNGVVKVIDEWNNDTAGTKSDAQFVVYSYGETAQGAYTQAGAIRPCTITRKDGENCNGNSTFRQGIGVYEGAGNDFYDDVLLAKSTMSGDLWFNVTDGTVSNLPTDHMRPLFTGAVGVKKKDPGSAPLPSGISAISSGSGGIMLDVDGTIKAGAVRTDNLCNLSGTYCINNDYTNGFFSVKNTGVTGANVSGKNDCPDGQVMTGISGGGVVCAFPSITSGTSTAVSCPPGTWISSILTDRKIVCTNGVVCPGGSGCT